MDVCSAAFGLFLSIFWTSDALGSYRRLSWSRGSTRFSSLSEVSCALSWLLRAPVPWNLSQTAMFGAHGGAGATGFELLERTFGLRKAVLWAFCGAWNLAHVLLSLRVQGHAGRALERARSFVWAGGGASERPQQRGALVSGETFYVKSQLQHAGGLWDRWRGSLRCGVWRGLVERYDLEMVCGRMLGAHAG